MTDTPKRDRVYRTCDTALERYTIVLEDGGVADLSHTIAADVAASYIAIVKAMGGSPAAAAPAMKLLRDTHTRVLDGIEKSPRWPGNGG